MLLCHPLGGGMGAVEHALDVQIHGLIKQFRGVACKGGAFRHTGVVHQNVDFAVLCGNGVHSSLHGSGIGKVRADALHHSIRQLGFQFGHRVVGGLLTAGAQHHRSALLQKGLDSGQTDTTAAAGDNCNFIFQ